jgi:hypothetical protein
VAGSRFHELTFTSKSCRFTHAGLFAFSGVSYLISTMNVFDIDFGYIEAGLVN